MSNTYEWVKDKVDKLDLNDKEEVKRVFDIALSELADYENTTYLMDTKLHKLMSEEDHDKFSEEIGNKIYKKWCERNNITPLTPEEECETIKLLQKNRRAEQ